MWRKKIVQKLSRNFNRVKKHTKQRFVAGPKTARALFICGAQRSGTNMLQQVLDHCISTRVYNENNSRAFIKYRLRDKQHLQNLIKKSPCQWVVFKSLMDSQRISELLEEFPKSRCLWIYRDYRDVAVSAENKWSSAQRHIIRNIAEQDESWIRWYTENLPNHRRAQVKAFYHEEISELSAGALKWYLRNAFFIDLNLQNAPDRVLLLNYDHLVSHPHLNFKRIQDFLGIEISPAYYQQVHQNAINKERSFQIESGIKEICENLMSQLARVYN